MQTETATADPWRGAQRTETGCYDSGGPVGEGDTAQAINGAIDPVDNVPAVQTQLVWEPTVRAATITTSARTQRAAITGARTKTVRAQVEPADPIADLIACLAAAADTAAPVSLGRGARDRVHRVSGGFRVDMSDRR